MNDTPDIIYEKGKPELDDYELVYQTCDYPVLMTVPHYHNVIEIIYVLEGEFVITINEAKHTVGPGEMILINSKAVHTINIMDYGIHKSFAIKFVPEIVCSNSQSLMELKYVIPYIISFSNFKIHYTKEEVESTNIKNCIDNIIKEDREKTYAYKLAIRVFISHLFLELIRKVNTITLIEEEPIDEDIKNKFASIFQYISTNYSNKLTAVQITKEFKIRQSDFSSYFRKITGKSFNEYLTYTRVCKAKKLLVSTKKNISEIAYSVGFSNPSYFITCFKVQTGTTPAEFKQLYFDHPDSIYYSLYNQSEHQIFGKD